MAKRKKKPARRKKKAVKRKVRKSTNWMSVASKNKTFRNAKKAEAKAAARRKKAWKKASVIAKKKVKRMKYC